MTHLGWFSIDDLADELAVPLGQVCDKAREIKQPTWFQIQELALAIPGRGASKVFSGWARLPPTRTEAAHFATAVTSSEIEALVEAKQLPPFDAATLWKYDCMYVPRVGGVAGDDGTVLIDQDVDVVAGHLDGGPTPILRPRDLYVDGRGRRALYIAFSRPDLAKAVARPKRPTRALSLTRERTLYRVIGACVLKLQEERSLAVAHKRPVDLPSIIADIAKDAESLAKQHRVSKRLTPDLPGRFGAGKQTVGKDLHAGVRAIEDDYWDPESI